MDSNITHSDHIPCEEDSVVNSGLEVRHRICTVQSFDCRSLEMSLSTVS